MSAIKISGPTGRVQAELDLSGSKSISNRVLLIRSLCSQGFNIENLSSSDDTQVLLKALDSEDKSFIDLHHAGTSFRFITAFLAIQPGSQILSGSERMQNRPVGALVEALNAIGADIEYLENPGYPPLKINAFRGQISSEITIKANVSSQFISALCMIAPCLPQGLSIELEDSLVSRPYLEMTLAIMDYFGAGSHFEGNWIDIAHSEYKARNFIVESDWSSASYHYGLCALLPGSRIALRYYYEESTQGDSKISTMAEHLGVKTSFASDGVILENIGVYSDRFDYDYIEQPDLFQTIAAVCAGLGIHHRAKGLSTLAMKESDRVIAMKAELAKVGVSILESEEDSWEYILKGQALEHLCEFESYDDHRMAMALSLLACIHPVIIKDPSVVTKSYPSYWEDLKKMGFKIEEV